ncbi:MAG: hypothetical protein IKQ40_00690, partial [Lachnospiraceae bacterium]|nr:hypothetical protein [Lachnospiraceae bacterium]
MSEGKRRFGILKILLSVLLAVVIVAALYVAYVFLTYSRIEDNLEIEPGGSADAVASAGEKYTIVTYNVGYGAYTADYTFFMDAFWAKNDTNKVQT